MKKEIFSGTKKYIKRKDQEVADSQSSEQKTRAIVKDWHKKQAPSENNEMPQNSQEKRKVRN